jgi:SAM-dependent methyltransferase
MARMASILQRALGRLRTYKDQLRYPIRSLPLYLTSVSGKTGIEIGGPSQAFRNGNVAPIYDLVGSLDNCDFSSNTVWAEHAQEFVYSTNRPPGRSFFCEGSNLTPVPSQSYDFVLSSHNLEHFANPVKALHEWKRILRPGGALVLILPYYRNTFDHRRTPTPVAAMLDDFERNIGEDDLSHLPEILDRHDLTRDKPAGSFIEFERRSRDNFNNRCLHHHVFDETNSRDLLIAAGFEVLAVDIAPPIHLCLLARVSEVRS